MTTATFNVANAAQLAAAIKLSTGGETINLASGDYGALSLYKFAPTSTVTIQSSPMAGTVGNIGMAAKPIFTGISTNLTSNVTFNGLEVTQSLAKVTSDQVPMITIGSSSNISLLNMDVHGTVNHNPLDDMTGLRVNLSHGIQVSGSSFHDLRTAALVSSNTAVVISNNTIYDVREGLDVVDAHHLLIDHNLIYNVIPNYAIDKTIPLANYDHPDMIQMWTNNIGPSDDVSITNNALLLGTGMDTHGIFISSQSGLNFTNFLIENNLVSTNNIHGISLDHIVGAIVDNNTVLTAGGTQYTAGINLNNDGNIQFSDNVSTYFSSLNSTAITDTGSIKLHTGGATDATNVLDNFVNPLKLLTTSVSDFNEAPGGLVATSGAGFDSAQYNAKVSLATYDALVHSLDAGAYLHHIA